MKMYCIADTSEFEVGFKLAGCDGICLNDPKSIEKKIDEITENKDIGVLVLSKKVYEMSKQKIDFIRLNKKLPLVAII